MYRLSILLLFVLLVVEVVAAPAPPRREYNWISGWDKSLGDGRFVRKTGKLTLIVQGRSPDFPTRGCLDAARLLRDVEGDFDFQVRISGNFALPPPEKKSRPLPGEEGTRRAGILLTDGKIFVWWARAAVQYRPDIGVYGGSETCGKPGGGGRYDGPPLDRPAYLRLERRGDVLEMWYSQDGKKWETIGGGKHDFSTRKLKVGVFADATIPGEFQIELSELKVTLLKK